MAENKQNNQQPKKPLSKSKKLIILQVTAFIVSILPLLVVLGMNWGEYTETPEETTKLCFGGVLVLIFILLKFVCKIKFSYPLVISGSCCLLFYLLESLVKDAILISGMACLGEMLDLVFFHFPIKNLKKEIEREKQGKETTAQVEELFKKYTGRGGRT